MTKKPSVIIHNHWEDTILLVNLSCIILHPQNLHDPKQTWTQKLWLVGKKGNSLQTGNHGFEVQLWAFHDVMFCMYTYDCTTHYASMCMDICIMYPVSRHVQYHVHLYMYTPCACFILYIHANPMCVLHTMHVYACMCMYICMCKYVAICHRYMHVYIYA